MNRNLFTVLVVLLLSHCAFPTIIIVDSMPQVIQIHPQKYLISFDETSGHLSSSSISTQALIPLANTLISSNSIKSSSQEQKPTKQALVTSQQIKKVQTSTNKTTNLKTQSVTSQTNTGGIIGNNGNLSINQMIYDAVSSNDRAQTPKMPIFGYASKPSNQASQPSPTSTSNQQVASVPNNNSSSATTSSGSPSVGLSLPQIGLANPTTVGK